MVKRYNNAPVDGLRIDNLSKLERAVVLAIGTALELPKNIAESFRIIFPEAFLEKAAYGRVVKSGVAEPRYGCCDVHDIATQGGYSRGHRNTGTDVASFYEEYC